MFINDVNKEEIRNVVIQDLGVFGIKYRPKKQRQHVEETRIGCRVFKTALRLLPMQTVTLTSGQQLAVPKVVYDLCSFILTKVETEGLFRKGGSKTRQTGIQLLLDTGSCLGDDHHEIDVANILKMFFRKLPEPLFPYSYHELFLRCTLLEADKLQALLLTCLLLPTEHLNTLAYFMQFLHQVTEHSALNKMDSYNLAVIIAPTIFPMEEKVAHRLTKICELFKLLIENASSIGVISEHIIDQISLSGNSLSDEEVINTKRKKKRRSGSLTRMFNGFRKMVGSKSVDDTPPKPMTPDLPATPNLTKSAKKRKLEAAGFSHKKRRELLQSLSQGTALSTPVSVHPNPKKLSPSKSTRKSNNLKGKEKKPQWNLGSKRSKHPKDDNATSTNSNGFSGTKAVLERRWSAVSQAAEFKRKIMQNSSIVSSVIDKKVTPDKASNAKAADEGQQALEPDYVKILRTEYEEIKSRVSALEHRISIELDIMQDQDSTAQSDSVEKVQTAYEKTLTEAEPLSPTTDQLAGRLSKELKIRRSAEQKVVRSPNARLLRNQSWHIPLAGSVPKINMKGGQPNTVLTGLRHPTPITATDSTLDDRTSIVKLRSQNAGMVLAKAHLFDGMIDSDNSSNSQNSAMSIPSAKGGTKIGAARNADKMNRMHSLRYDEKRLSRQYVSPRKRNLKSRKLVLSANTSSSHTSCTDEKENQVYAENCNVDFLGSTEKAGALKDCNRISRSDSRLKPVLPAYATPRGVPQIKRSLTVKSPKRICRTPKNIPL